MEKGQDELTGFLSFSFLSFFKKMHHLLNGYRQELISIHAGIVAEDPILPVLSVIALIRMDMPMDVNAPAVLLWPGEHGIMHQGKIDPVQGNRHKILYLDKKCWIILLVMVADQKDFLPVHPGDPPVCFLYGHVMADVPQDVYRIILMDHGVIIPQKTPVHVIHIGKWPVPHSDDTPVSQMEITGKVDQNIFTPLIL